jgi:catalase
MLARFSTVAQEAGSADSVHDPRGFALKFLHREGNYDLVGDNTPIFFIRDPQKFQDFIHSQKRRADNHLRDNNMQWDFWTLSPESAHQVTFLMSDRGIPRTCRHLNGYGGHTFLWENAGGGKFWAKYHFETVPGIETFPMPTPRRWRRKTRTTICAICITRSPTATHRSGNSRCRSCPSKTRRTIVQSFRPDQSMPTQGLSANPDRPGRTESQSGKPFCRLEHFSFEPANMVRGISPSPDNMFLGRLFSYPDTHRHQIGTNYVELPVCRFRPCTATIATARRATTIRPIRLCTQLVWRAEGRPSLRVPKLASRSGRGRANCICETCQRRRLRQPGTLDRDVMYCPALTANT